jgi:hypothetical protein
VDDALRVKPDDFYVQSLSAELALVLARAGHDEKRARAESLLRRVLDADAGNFEALRVVAALHRDRARALAGKHADASDDVRAALDACSRALEAMPGDPQTLAVRASVELIAARARNDAAAVDSARAALAAAIANDARLARELAAL